MSDVSNYMGDKTYYGKCATPAEAIRMALYACGIEGSGQVEVPEVLHALSEAGFQITPKPAPVTQ